MSRRTDSILAKAVAAWCTLVVCLASPAPMHAAGDQPLSEILDARGARFTFDETTRMVKVQVSDRTIRMVLGNPYVIVDGKTIKLSAPPRKAEGDIVVPFDFEEKILGVTGKADEEGEEEEPAKARPVTEEEPEDPDEGGAAEPEETAEVETEDEAESEVPRFVVEQIKYRREANALTLDVIGNREADRSQVLMQVDESRKGVSISMDSVECRLSDQTIPVDENVVKTIRLILSGKNRVKIQVGAGAPVRPTVSYTNNVISFRFEKASESESKPLFVLGDTSEVQEPDEIAAETVPVRLDGVQYYEAELLKGIESLDWVIAIDPGHGGEDFGVVGPGKAKEKNVTLDIARRLEAIVKRTRMKPVLLRNGDYFLPIEKRVANANQKRAKLYVSLHANASLSRDARGLEVYYADPAATVAMKTPEEAGTIADPEIKAEVQRILHGLASKGRSEQSRRFADILQRTVVSSKQEIYSRGIRPVRLLLFSDLAMPAVLIELGFLTNRDDELLLSDPDFREKVAFGIFKGIREFAAETRTKDDARGGDK